MTPETKLRNQISRCLKTLKKEGEPIFFVKLHGGAMQRAGIPDFHLTYYGQSIWFEVKANRNVATPLQKQIIQEINRAKGCAMVVYSIEAVKQFLEGVKRMESRKGH